MGIINPRPAMRSSERKAVQKRLEDHAKFMAQFEAEGFSRNEASRRAFLMIKFGIKRRADADTPRGNDD